MDNKALLAISKALAREVLLRLDDVCEGDDNEALYARTRRYLAHVKQMAELTPADDEAGAELEAEWAACEIEAQLKK
jgi:hypothetical protein